MGNEHTGTILCSTAVKWMREGLEVTHTWEVLFGPLWLVAPCFFFFLNANRGPDSKEWSGLLDLSSSQE